MEGEKKTRKNIIHSVNHSEEHIQTKKVVNYFLENESIPRIRELSNEGVSSLYRFSCECQVLPVEEDAPDDSTLVEVIGKEGDFKFRGITSLDNWSSLSDTLYAVRNEMPYPLTGLVQIQNIEEKMVRVERSGEEILDSADCKVNFVFICQADQEDMDKWWNRRDLLKEYHQKSSH